MSLLEVDGLCKTYPGTSRPAIRDVSISLETGRTLGIVGESGSGKTTLVRCILRLIGSDAGAVRFDGLDFLALKGNEFRKVRRQIQLVPQHPESSLNPRMSSGGAIEFNLRPLHLSAVERRKRVDEILTSVGLSPQMGRRYPRELSGGQIQRVAIGRALATRPKVIICDEAVSALDKSIQAQILNLLVEFQAELGVAYLFISHDLSVIEHLSDHVVVMRNGEVIEEGSPSSVWTDPQHPYTKQLLDSLPGAERRKRTHQLQEGEQRTPVP